MSEATLHKPGTELYEEDFNRWLEKQAELLRQERFEELDLENLVEEVLDISRRDKREVKRHLIVLLKHVLKYQYQPDRRTESRLDTIKEQRRQLQFIFADSPSLRRHDAPTIVTKCYAKARGDAQDETTLPLAVFPEGCLYTLEQTLDETFLPS